MRMTYMTLSPRLERAAALCRPPCRLIDVGCDHGYLTIAVLEAGAASAISSDLRPGPLAKARENLRIRGLEDRVSLRLTDGLTGIRPMEGDTIAICGMGGETIAAILAAAPWTRAGAHRLVLQPTPVTRGEALRAFLHERGYLIEEEALVREGGKYYAVLAARGGGEAARPPLPDSHLLFTPRMKSDPLFGEYLAWQRRRYRRILAGLKRGGKDTARAEAILNHLNGAAEECL